jgi:hypothetical protein
MAGPRRRGRPAVRGAGGRSLAPPVCVRGCVKPYRTRLSGPRRARSEAQAARRAVPGARENLVWCTRKWDRSS